MGIRSAVVGIAILLGGGAGASVVWQEAESFAETGGWANDPQHIDTMGSPYLLATGLGEPVADAVTEVEIPEDGNYRLWVRCRDWFPSHSPGTFRVSVNGKEDETLFGKAADDSWQWIEGETFELAKGPCELRLADRTGWWGRVDALVLASDGYLPPNQPDDLNDARIRFNGVSTEVLDKGEFDLVVVGGGSSGLGAAIAAARGGIKVAFVQDRPVLGGNASDEIQVPPMGWIGTPPDQINVTGLTEELFPIQGWSNNADSEFLEEKVRAETNISLFLNTRGIGVEMASANRIAAVIGIDVRTGQRMRFRAPLFVDTTGHGWIGHYAGADYSHGTEARSEFNESLAPVEANNHTMGNSLYKAVTKRMDGPVPFKTPAWAYQWTSPDDFERTVPRIKKPIRHEAFDQATKGPGRPVKEVAGSRAWFVEYGGTGDTIEDAEKIRDELFRIHLGIWGYQKNHETPARFPNHKLVWLNYVPGVRESRRLMGDYIMTQRDFDGQVEHKDNVAFTDWGIDDHHPHGYFTKGIDVLHVYHGRRVSIPYRSLYSRNIDNLFMAGRCMSASHVALGGVRVQRPMMATGEVVGTAAAIANKHGSSPRGVYEEHLRELQQTLLRNGCYIVGVRNEDPSDLARLAKVSQPEITNGWNRESEGLPQGADWLPARPITLEWETLKTIREVHLSLNELLFRAEIVVEAKGGDGWVAVGERTMERDRIHRRQVFQFEPVKTTALRLRLLRKDRNLRLCEVRVYE
ncbi:FAD-dependent oxidoreductase [Haloferula helveola]|uniref:FAD-dependent oxidoreductase n=1 Tax=Haloferula helveola TaxID=490095 RepID=UPI0030D42A3B